MCIVMDRLDDMHPVDHKDAVRLDKVDCNGELRHLD